MRILAVILMLVFGGLGLMAAFGFTFLVNPGESYCIPLPEPNPEMACTMTAKMFVALAGGFFAGALVVLVPWGIVWGVRRVVGR